MKLPSRSLEFKIDSTVLGSKARAGTFKTLHTTVQTPLFMPVGTQATVRNVSAPTLKAAGSQILLANTFHLMLRPGAAVFEKFGGIHSFMKWSGSVLTDSGGFQVFSLSNLREVSEEGVMFASYVDGKRHLLSPEASIGMQRSIGSDIMMAMDLCIPSTSNFSDTLQAMEQTHRWAVRSLEARGDSNQAIFGIIQGACHEKLRQQSAKFIASLPFDGLAIGGLAVGETKDERERFTDLVTEHLPPDRPRYLMGVGTPIDLLEAVHRGVDMFDCIIPTQLAEQGVCFTSLGRVQLGRGVYKFSEEALDPDCGCHACQTHSRAYLHHIVKTCEPLSTQLIGEHNIWFYHSLMDKIRASIHNGTFLSFYKEWQVRLQTRDIVSVPQLPKIGRRPSRRPMQMGAFEIHVASDKLYSIRHSLSGEIMHPGKDPMTEARSLYLNQSQLVERVRALPSGEGLVVWDVGLGAAFNAMAVVEAVQNLESLGRVRLVSFENDLDALRLALCHPAFFPHLRHGGPHALIDGKVYQEGPLHWELHHGDFLETYAQAPAPDLIFFDPFSTETDTPLWSIESFQKIHSHLKAQNSQPKSCVLFNYTASTAVRARLLLAGFFVARGEASPPKLETTVALTQPKLEPAYTLLSHDWLEKLSRSGAKENISSSLDWAHLEGQLRDHEQFRSS